MTTAERRLTTVPWPALTGLGPTLAPALTELLAGQAAERVLDRLLRSQRHFTAEQRAVTAEALFGVGLWRRRLRAQLPDGTPLQLLAVLARELGGCLDADARLDTTLPPLAEVPPDWKVRFSFPDWIAAHYQARFGSDGAASLAAALNHPGPICLRARDDRTALARDLAACGITTVPGTLAANAVHVTSPRPNLLGLPASFLGRFEVQDEGSQCVTELLDVQPGDEVLDLCAGAGGKSLHLAALVGPKGRVHATDVDLARLDRLRTRASKAHVNVLRIHGATPPPDLRVSRVLIDAPCSELGALRRGPDLRWRIDPGVVDALVPTQRALLELGLRHLAPGGTLVYATCTLTHAENEGLLGSYRPTKELVLAPHTHGTDGFYAARVC